MPRANPRLVSLQHDLVGRDARVVRGLPLRAVVDDRRARRARRCGGGPTRRTAACTAGCPTRARRPTARARPARPAAVGGGGASAVPRDTPSSTASNSSVRRSQSKSRATTSSPFATSRAASASSSSSRRIASAIARRVARRHDERGLAVDRVLAAAAVVGRDERRAARERLEPGLAEALEPAADREHPRRRVLAAERGLLEVLARVPLDRDAEERGRPRGSCRCPSTPAAARRCTAAGSASGPDTGWNTSRLTPPSCTVGPVAGLGADLVGGPVAVGELEVDRRPRRSPSCPPCRRAWP